MTRICELTGVGVMSGNNVSHSQRKTRRRFLPNLHNVTLVSDKLGRKFRFRVSASALRTIELNGGLDSYILSAKTDKLSLQAQMIKKLLKKQEG